MSVIATEPATVAKRMRTPQPKEGPATASGNRPLFSALDTQVIYCGDNLDKLRESPDACVDLIYIDPPFNSNRNYEVSLGDTQEKRAFEDRHASNQAYIEFMRPRCEQLARMLKRTGSFYYHCDWHAGHYVKVMLDQIFGVDNFLNEIIWKRTHAHSSSDKYAPIHDTIFLYANGDRHTWNQPLLDHDEKYVQKHFKYRDEKTGRLFQPITLTGPGIRNGESGKPWCGIDPTKVNRHWAIPGEVFRRSNLKGKTVQEKLDALDQAGLIYWPKIEDGTPRLKWFVDEIEGVAVPDIWTDIPPISATAAERIGWPTQKPLPLLERIISASSNPDDIVLDAFCGCGTALVAAQNLGRRWIGIDISPTACRMTTGRLEEVCALSEDRDFVVRDLPHSVEFLRKIPPFEFENWAMVALGGTPNRSKIGDMGIDDELLALDHPHDIPIRHIRV